MFFCFEYGYIVWGYVGENERDRGEGRWIIVVIRLCRGEIVIIKNLSFIWWKNMGCFLIKENDIKIIDYFWVIGIFFEEYIVKCGGWCFI